MDSVKRNYDEFDSDNKEPLFWCNIIYTIGSYVIDTVCSSEFNQKKNIGNSQNPDLLLNTFKQINLDSQYIKKIKLNENKVSDSVIFLRGDPISKFFCGYWILYIIADEANESGNKTHYSIDHLSNVTYLNNYPPNNRYNIRYLPNFSLRYISVDSINKPTSNLVYHY